MAYLTSFDSKQLRTVLGTFTTGVTIVTTRDANGLGLRRHRQLVQLGVSRPPSRPLESNPNVEELSRISRQRALCCERSG